MTPAGRAAGVRRVPGAEPRTRPPAQLTRFAYQARHAGRYRDARILLAGDAARLFLSGQGISAGIPGAVNLARKPAAVLPGRASPGLPGTYQGKRYPIGARARSPAADDAEPTRCSRPP
jgi:2-polyprenyl-6-methoxyphenol hydroxylase-like FAD-dependent oxidoreductase